MSRANVELYRRAAEAVTEGDLDGFLALMDADVEAFPRLAPMEGRYRGHDGLRRWWESMHDALPDFRVEVVEVRDLGDVTLAEVLGSGRGAASDTPVEQRSWHVCEWRDGKIVLWRSYETQSEAVEAVGLRE